MFITEERNVRTKKLLLIKAFHLARSPNNKTPVVLTIREKPIAVAQGLVFSFSANAMMCPSKSEK